MGKIVALVLAAGYSRRMKKNKMLLPFGTGTVIEHTVQKFFQAQMDGVAVVVGHEQERIRQALSSYPVRFIENPHFPEGMSTSVKEGIRVLGEDPLVEGVMIIPGDMPLVQIKTISAMREIFYESFSSIIIPLYEGKRGHPALFARSLFPRLQEITGDIGARDVVRENLTRCCFLKVNDPGILIDIDSPEEYARMVRTKINARYDCT
jgi:molybdenum cofactor cytidylyltransferase